MTNCIPKANDRSSSETDLYIGIENKIGISLGCDYSLINFLFSVTLTAVQS